VTKDLSVSLCAFFVRRFTLWVHQSFQKGQSNASSVQRVRSLEKFLLVAVQLAEQIRHNFNVLAKD
jgi:hypothetical protein